jgi:hypothetical protein
MIWDRPRRKRSVKLEEIALDPRSKRTYSCPYVQYTAMPSPIAIPREFREHQTQGQLVAPSVSGIRQVRVSLVAYLKVLLYALCVFVSRLLELLPTTSVWLSACFGCCVAVVYSKVRYTLLGW